MNVLAKRDGSEKVFPNEERGYRYYMEQIAEQPISGQNTNQVASTMQLEWTGALKDTTRIRQVGGQWGISMGGYNRQEPSRIPPASDR